MISRYEAGFAQVARADYAFSFWKGRVALYAILKALGVGSRDEVILPGFTCVVVSNAVRFAGATPVFADITPGTYNIDPHSVERAITRRTRALIVQHSFGIPADLDRLLEIASRHRLPLIEDCAHALGSTYRGKLAGTLGIASFFSSQWSKPYTTGLGGIAITSDREMAEGLRNVRARFTDPPQNQVMRLRAQYALYQRFFSPRLYWAAVNTLHRMSDWNLFVGSSGTEELNCSMPVDTMWRLSAFQAASGLKKLQTLPQSLSHRRRLAEFYEGYLRARGWQPCTAPANTEPVYLRYPIRVANKSELLRESAAARIELGSWFESTLHPIRTSLERFGYQQGLCPVAEQTADEVVNLPMHPRVSVEEAARIVDFVCRKAERPVLQVEQLSSAVSKSTRS